MFAAAHGLHLAPPALVVRASLTPSASTWLTAVRQRWRLVLATSLPPRAESLPRRNQRPFSGAWRHLRFRPGQMIHLIPLICMRAQFPRAFCLVYAGTCSVPMHGCMYGFHVCIRRLTDRPYQTFCRGACISVAARSAPFVDRRIPRAFASPTRPATFPPSSPVTRSGQQACRSEVQEPAPIELLRGALSPIQFSKDDGGIGSFKWAPWR